MSAPTTVTSAPASLDSFKCKKTLTVDGETYAYYSLPDAEKNGLAGISKLPYSMKVLLENLLRHEDGRTVTKADIVAKQVEKFAGKRKGGLTKDLLKRAGFLGIDG